MLHVSISGWHACVAGARIRELACARTGATLLHRLLLQLGSGSCTQALVALQFDVGLHALHQRSGLGDKLLFEELWYGVVDELWPGVALLVDALRVGVPDVGLEVGRL